MQTLSLMQAVTMDIISLGVDTAALSLIQNKVVVALKERIWLHRVVVALMNRGSLDRVVRVVLMDRGSLLLVTIGHFHLEHNPLEGV